MFSVALKRDRKSRIKEKNSIPRDSSRQIEKEISLPESSFTSERFFSHASQYKTLS
jgi:hypothetical protein